MYVCACTPLLMLKRQCVYHPVFLPRLLSLRHTEKLTTKTWVESLRAAISVLQYKKSVSFVSYFVSPFIPFCSHQLSRNVIDILQAVEWERRSRVPVVCETRAQQLLSRIITWQNLCKWNRELYWTSSRLGVFVPVGSVSYQRNLN